MEALIEKVLTMKERPRAKFMTMLNAAQGAKVGILTAAYNFYLRNPIVPSLNISASLIYLA
jgi:hypothetical protein